MKPSSAPTFPGLPSKTKADFPGVSDQPHPAGPVEVISQQLMSNREASDSLAQHGWGQPFAPDRYTSEASPSLRFVVAPGADDACKVDEVSLGPGALQDTLIRELLHGKPPLFLVKLIVDTQERPDSLAFHQNDPSTGKLLVEVELSTDGAITISHLLGTDSNSASSSAAMFIIDEGEVRSYLEAAIAFAASVYRFLECDVDQWVIGVSLAGISNKYFGQVPRDDRQSFTLPNHQIADPLIVPQSPMTIAPQQFADPSGLAANLVARIARAFRVEGGYYPSATR
jgi:hypothetical protein